MRPSNTLVGCERFYWRLRGLVIIQSVKCFSAGKPQCLGQTKPLDCNKTALKLIISWIWPQVACVHFRAWFAPTDFSAHQKNLINTGKTVLSNHYQKPRSTTEVSTSMYQNCVIDTSSLSAQQYLTKESQSPKSPEKNPSLSLSSDNRHTIYQSCFRIRFSSHLSVTGHSVCTFYLLSYTWTCKFILRFKRSYICIQHPTTPTGRLIKE